MDCISSNNVQNNPISFFIKYDQCPFICFAETIPPFFHFTYKKIKFSILYWPLVQEANSTFCADWAAKEILFLFCINTLKIYYVGFNRIPGQLGHMWLIIFVLPKTQKIIM